MNRIRWYGPTLVLLITVLVVMIAGPQMVRRMAWAQTDANIKLAQNELKESDFLAQLSDSFRKVADSVKHSVVSIEVLSRQDREGPRDMFRRFFGPDMPGQPGQRPDGNGNGNGDDEGQYEEYDPARPFGNGSGWVYAHSDGEHYIITNAHVIRKADKIRVRFVDGSKREATVVGTDPRTDVAVLKVEADGLHPAAVADKPPQQGDMVFAFGSPFRFDFSLSQGIVSAKGRQLGIIGPGGYENFIQTDAAINPGNSGGPLTNIYGEVVGMNTAIASRTGTYNGLGFAIPVQMVTDVADQIIEQGEVQRGYLGVYIEDIDEQKARTFGYDSGDGVLVVDPLPDSPAAKAGLKEGDIITQVEGEAVENADELRYKIAGYPPGTDVEVTVFRGGETMSKTITLAQLPERGQLSSRGPGGGDSGDAGQPDESQEGVKTLRKLGLQAFQTFTQQMAGQLDAPHKPGVLVRRVRSGSTAATNGLSPGMIITRVMGQPVESVQQLVAEVEKHEPSQPLRLRIAQWNPDEEQYRERFVFLELPEAD